MKTNPYLLTLAAAAILLAAPSCHGDAPPRSDRAPLSSAPPGAGPLSLPPAPLSAAADHAALPAAAPHVPQPATPPTPIAAFAPACVPDCAGRSCGGDGCGGSCGDCDDAQGVCEDGVCVCVPDCAGRSCGDDGCGGSCGGCDGPAETCEVGACVCAPDCANRRCGDDGCGGSCGDCPPGASCLAGGCVEGCGDVPSEGCCHGNTLWWCEQGELLGGSCHAPGPVCGWSPWFEAFACSVSQDLDPTVATAPRTCSTYVHRRCTRDADCDDGDRCSRDTCEVGACVYTDVPDCCTPNCDDADCGPDGCGGICGACGVAEHCGLDGRCRAGTDTLCAAIGIEGCCDGSVLWWCQDGALMSGDCGINQPPYDVCGWESGFAFNCGSDDPVPPDVTGQCPGIGDCEEDARCDDRDPCSVDSCVDGRCAHMPRCGPDERCDPATGGCEPCVPQCDGRTCGSDGCGGTCGACGAAETCFAGRCQRGCGDLGYAGCCHEDVVWWCGPDGIEHLDCGAPGLQCGWDANERFYDCGDQLPPADPGGLHPRSCVAYHD